MVSLYETLLPRIKKAFAPLLVLPLYAPGEVACGEVIFDRKITPESPAKNLP